MLFYTQHAIGRSVYVVTRKAVGFGMGYVGGRMEVAKGTQLNATYVMSQKNKVRPLRRCVCD